MFLNLAMRGGTLASKFLLIFFLAKYLSVSEVGLYGLLTAFVGYSLYVVGIEFYNFSSREIILAPSEMWLRLIRDQFVLYCLLYVCLMPGALLFFYYGVLPIKYFGWFVILAVLEHIAQEMNRLFVSMSEQLLASLVLFIRSGLWCLVVCVSMIILPVTRTLEFVLYAWVSGCALACLLGFVRLCKLSKVCLKVGIDWSWLKRGVMIALPFLVGTLALRGIFTLDRYFVEALFGIEAVGAYVLFIGMATAVISFLDAGVIVYFYPRLVALAKEERSEDFYCLVRQLAARIILFALMLAGLCYAFSFYVLAWIDKKEYSEFRSVLFWLLAATVLYGVSMVPHLALYAFKKDRHIVFSQSAGLLVFVMSSWVSAREYGIVAVAWSMCIAFCVILGWKYYAYLNMRSYHRKATNSSGSGLK